jgi:hypothetical protein
MVSSSTVTFFLNSVALVYAMSLSRSSLRSFFHHASGELLDPYSVAIELYFFAPAHGRADIL